MSFGSTTSQFSPKSGKACICLCGLKFPSRKDDKCPDHLQHWERWLDRRKKMHEKLFKKLRRHPASLLMNSGDCYRSIQEEKSILEYTKIETHFDKYRGNPEFWTLPCALKEKSPPYKFSEYFAVKSKAEKNQVPELEYVGVPDYIYNEKDVAPRTRYLKRRWAQSSYRNKVVKRMSEKLAEIQPHKPDLDQLIIIGNGAPKAVDVRFSKIEPSAKVVDNSSDFEESILPLRKAEVSKESKISITICNKKIIEGQYLSREDRISILFEYFIGHTTNKPTEQCLSLENTGLVTLRLNWLKYHKLKLFREYTETDIISKPFKFNKSQILLVPGQKIEFPLWFQVQKPGTYFEHWELTTEPRIWSEDLHFLVLLKGYAYIQNYQEKILEVTLKLQQMVRDSSIKDFLNSVVDRGSYCHPTTSYVYDFSEKELFQSANLKKDLVKYSPKYVYNSTVVKELKDFYAEIKSPEDPKEWDLCVKNLIEASRRKDLAVFFEKKLELYKLAKERRRTLRESSETKKRTEAKADDKGSTKEKGKKNSKVFPKQPETSCVVTYHEQLRSILSRLEQPSIQPNPHRLKMFFCYLILKTSLGTMWNKLDQLELTDPSNNVGSILSSRSSPTVVPDRLVYEIFEDSYILRTKRIPHQPGPGGAKPKPLNLRINSGSDLKKMFKAYFGKDEGPKSVKSTKPPKDEGKSEAKSDGKKSKQKGKNQDNQLQEGVDPDYDPYREEYPSEVCESISELPVTASSSTIDPREPINHEKYLIVYTALCNAVDAMVDTIEGFTARNLPSDYLRELQNCKIKPPIEETYSSRESSQIINEEEQRSQSQTDYFNFLLDTHWQSNWKTQKYFMKDETISTKDVLSLTESQSSGTVIQMPDMFSLKDFERKPVPYGLKDGTTQTDLCQFIAEKNGEDTVVGDSKRQSTKSVGEVSAEDIFYILRNDNEQQSGESKSSLSQVGEDVL